MPRSRACSTILLLCLALACGGDGPPSAAEAPAPAPTETTEQAPTTRVAFTLAQRDLLPENIAYDPVEEAVYIGSSRFGKVVKRAADGTLSDFTTPRQDGLWMVMGMKVDAERRHLWVASADGDNLVGYQRARSRPAGIFQFDLETGRLLRKWLLDGPGGTHFFNDLVVTPEGTVYATHMFNRSLVYVIDESGELQIFARPGNFRAPNGITQGDDGTLYVAHREGLSAFDPATAQRTPLVLPDGAAFSPIDGLYFHRGALIAVHPEEGLIRRFELDGTAVTALETLAGDHPAITGLTTGVLVDDRLLFVANSQFDRLADGSLPSAEELDDIVVLELDLG